MNRAMAGKQYPPVVFVVDADRVALFATAVGAPEGSGVPPTFVTAIEFAGFPAIIEDPELGLDFTRVVHGEQSYEWSRALRVGETVTATAQIGSIRMKGENAFLAIETRVVGASDEHVVTARATLIERAP
jgi:acyl dehydratase